MQNKDTLSKSDISRIIEMAWEDRTTFDAIAEMTPLQKVTTIEDFSDAALFFASDQSRSITGQNLTVDGGLTFN